MRLPTALAGFGDKRRGHQVRNVGGLLDAFLEAREVRKRILL